MKIENKRAFFNYFIEEKIEAGIVLTGGEARAIREGHMDLSNSYAKVINTEVFLVNANIPINGAKNYEATRSRKLLLNRAEITGLASKMKQKRLTLVPTKVYNVGRLVKVEIALAKPKREFDKKETLKARDVQRDIDMSLKE